jgi:hypothetical protein
MNLGDVKGIGKINAFFPLPSPLQGEGEEGSFLVGDAFPTGLRY